MTSDPGLLRRTHSTALARTASELVKLAERRMIQGRALNLTVLRLDAYDRPNWDASGDVAQVFAAICWPASGCEAQRAETIDIFKAILSA